MQPLLDGDILVYEIAATAQYINEDGETILRPWDWVSDAIDEKIEYICKLVEATTKPLIFLTGDERLHKLKARVRPSLPIYKPNFRIERAKLRPYKDTRTKEKPYYYNAIRAYLVGVYDAYVSIGMEADDELAIEQTRAMAEGRETIICTRDKDLRQVPGWHYGWECGKQLEFGPHYYDELGEIALNRSKSTSKIEGGGFLFFLSQLFTGDPVDTIPGLPRYGPVKVYGLLGDIKDTKTGLDVVRHHYSLVYPDDWKEQLREQCDLLWMIRHKDEDGNPIFFNPKEYS